MTEQDALLRVILLTPEDDVARLVYADWLEEHDEASYAAFIRYQIESGRTGNFVCGHDSTGWFPGTHELGDKASVTVSRGFVSHIELPATAFLTHARDIFRRHPVTSVRLTDREPATWGGPSFRTAIGFRFWYDGGDM